LIENIEIYKKYKLIKLLTYLSVPIICLLTSNRILAQGIYTELGFNTLGNLSYENVDLRRSKSNRVLLPQMRFEAGLTYELSEKLNVSLGLSNNNYNFTNQLYIPVHSSQHDTVHMKSMFEFNFVGANLGLSLDMYKDRFWRFYASGKVSANLLTRGSRTDKFVDSEPLPLSNLNPNLMVDDYFRKDWYNFQFGLGLSYKITPNVAFYTQYHFSQSLKPIKSKKETYNFSSHDISFGVSYALSEHLYGKSLVRSAEVRSVPTQVDLSQPEPPIPINSEDTVANNLGLKIYFPSNSSEYYENHTEELERLAGSLLKDPSLQYYLLAYYQNERDKTDAINRLKMVLSSLMKWGVSRSQIIVDYKLEERTSIHEDDLRSRRIELLNK